MLRLVLLLLLALPLWPATAAAGVGVGVPAREVAVPGAPDELRGPDAGSGEDALRSSLGLELLRGVESRGPRACSQRSGPGSSGDPGVVGARAVLVFHPRPLAGIRAHSVDLAVAPVCERLPYHATAPPSLR